MAVWNTVLAKTKLEEPCLLDLGGQRASCRFGHKEHVSERAASQHLLRNIGTNHVLLQE